MAVNQTDKPNLISLLESVKENILSSMNTCLPGFVVSYDRATQTAEIQPSIKRVYIDKEPVNLPIVNRVPILFPTGNNAHIHFDLKKGDEVTLVFSQRSIELWKEKGGLIRANDQRKFNLSDGFAFPGGKPPTSPIELKGDAGDFEIVNGTSEFIIKPDGKFKIANATNELIESMFELTTALETATTTFGSIFNADTIAAITEVKTKLESLKA